MAKSITDFLPSFEGLTKKPEVYLSVQDSVANSVTCLLKDLYDYTKNSEDDKTCRDALPELIVDGFDEEQIWQELELQNSGSSIGLVADVAALVARKARLAFPLEDEEVGSGGESVSDRHELSEDDVGDSEKESEDEVSKKKKKEKRRGLSRVTEVDDKFFKLSEMEEFLEKEEKVQEDSDDELIDLFRMSEEEEEGSDRGFQYSDFFDTPYDEDDFEVGGAEEGEEEEAKKEEGADKRVRFLLSDDDDKKEKPQPKSNLEGRQERLNARIQQLEEQALAEKPWQLKGEVSASSRPQNSLLEEFVEFDLITRPAPVITEKTTLQLEDIIVQRIKDQVWDDVERKVKPVQTPSEYKKKLVLDQEKSKLSLAQVYEQEYLKQREAQNVDEAEDKQEEEPPEHQVVRSMMASLFAKLDALSNFHYTPRKPAPEVKIVSNLPAISMEEVAPVATSDGALLAPEEVKERPKGDLIGKGERTKTDKKRQHRRKKRRQRERQLHQERRQKAEVEKARPGLGNKYSKEKALRDLENVTKKNNVTKMDEKQGSKSLHSSTAFFYRLEDEVKTLINKKRDVGNSVQKQNIPSAKKLKL